MIGDLANQVRAEIAAQNRSFSIQKRALVNLKSLPLKEGETPLTNPDLRYTDLNVWVKYKPAVSTQFREKPYVVISDLFPGKKVRVKNWMGFLKLGQKAPEAKWIIDNCDINIGTFGVARGHIEMRIPVGFNACKYLDKIKRKAEDPNQFIGFRTGMIAAAEKDRVKTWLEEEAYIKGAKV